jgi:hypothetical protein
LVAGVAFTCEVFYGQALATVEGFLAGKPVRVLKE